PPKLKMKYYNFYKSLTRYLWDIAVVVFILWGIFAFLTPFTPGSWLFFVGLFVIFGRKRTENRVEKIIGKKWFGKLNVKKLLGKIPTR
ncbi:MAG: hypothetical protein AAB640_00335, partial [Patescibacteria group bacterium]